MSEIPAQRPTVLSDVFNLPLPKPPAMRNSKTSSSTKGPTDSQRDMIQHKQLQWVVYDEDLAERLVKKADAIAAKVKIDERDDDLRTSWRGRVYPLHTPTLLTGIINSEEDAREWIHQVLVHPALACIRATLDNGIGGILGDRLYIASSPAQQNKAIADGLFYTDPHADERVLCFEYKTPNSLAPLQFERIQSNLYLADGASSDAGKRAMRFFWPGQDAERIHHDTKLFVQVWSEMLDNGVKHAILTSYETTFFFYRAPDQPNTLFMSKQYVLQPGESYHSPLAAIYAWMLSALGHLEVELPRIDADWKKKIAAFPAISHGLDTSSAQSVGESLRGAQARLESGTGRETRSIASYRRDRLDMHVNPESPRGEEHLEHETPADSDTSPSGRITPPPLPLSPDTTPRAPRVAPRSAHPAQQPPPSMTPTEDRQEGTSRSGRQQATQRGARSGGVSRDRQARRKGTDTR